MRGSLEHLELPPASVLLHADETHGIHGRSHLDLHAGIVFPVALDLMAFELAACQHHGEVRAIEGVVGQSQLQAFELEPQHLARMLSCLQVGAVGGLRLVHLAGLQSAECLQALLSGELQGCAFESCVHRPASIKFSTPCHDTIRSGWFGYRVFSACCVRRKSITAWCTLRNSGSSSVA